ncbi:transcription factor grauzone-like [Condylostylus longicornis]|uniref:transcription factor grauzone-like n=1 Tax=Condylostylus longicornis TaxID=2530218 RepID=UPI00244DF2E9|nr:transcription factor grauzone-like [Condylostylus longicornis]
MICRLCLCDTENYFGFFDSYGLNVSAASIVSKHFWFEPKIDDSMSIYICVSCWETVKHFNDLFNTVQKAHNILNENVLLIKSDPGESELLNNDNPTNEIISDNKDAEFDWDRLDFDKINSDFKTEAIDGDEVEEKVKLSVLKKVELESEIKTEKVRLRKRGRKRKKKLVQLTSDEENETQKTYDNFDSERENGQVNDKNNFKSEENAPTNKLAEEDKKIATFMKMICSVCQSECHSFSSLRWHFNTKHKQKGFAICCDKKFFKRSNLVDHVEKHINPESFKCNLCNKICISRWTLKLHISRVHENLEPGHQCSFCGKSFKLKTILKRHQLIHMPEEEKKFICNECGKKYPSKGTLSSHIRIYHDRRYAGMCDICGKTYNNKEDVRRHRLEVHEGVAKESVKCKICFKEFATKYQYNIHKVEEHGDPNQKPENRCKYCDKISANSEALKRHIQKVHKAKLKFFCNFCDKVFKTDLSLKEHETTHTGEPLYVCPHCPRTFTHNSNMHHHRKRAHPVEFEQARKKKNEKKETWLQITAFQN